MTGNKSFIHRGIRNAKSEVDFDDKATVQRFLSWKFGIKALMDEVIFIHKQTGKQVILDQTKFTSKEEIQEQYFVHLPDLIIKGFRFLIVVEIDGDVHWQNSKAVKNTNARNEHYDNAGIEMLWLTKNEARKTDLLENVLFTRLSTILGFEPVRL